MKTERSIFLAKYAPPPPPTHHNKGTGRRGSKFPNHKTSKIAAKTIGPTRRVLQGTLLWGIWDFLNKISGHERFP